MIEKSAPALRLRGVSKRFGEVVASDGVSLELLPGEVHALLGENGAGKSTLIAMLAGMQQPDAGTIELRGERVVLGSPAVSLSHGIGIVYQHSALIPTMTVIENLMLGDAHRLLLDRRAAEDRLAELGVLLGGRIDPGTLVGELGLGQQQQLELAKALWARPSVLVLDEPTSMLTPRGVAELASSLDRLRGEGVAVLFVTHKLDEALGLADRVTVLRAGRVVARFGPGELRGGRGADSTAAVETRAVGADGADAAAAAAPILAAMFGDERAAPQRPEGEAPIGPPEPPAEAAEVLRLEEASTAPGDGGTPIRGISLRIRAGEVLGIAGIDGHGQRHLAEAIAGQRATAGGRVLLDGGEITRESVRERQRLGVRYVTDDRLREGIVGSFSVALNLVLKRVGERPFWRFGRMDRAAVAAEARRLISHYDIRASSPDARAGALSGGNIQKILLARELSHGPRVVVFNKPGQGLDLRTVRKARDEIRRFAEAGGAVLLISTELDELAELAHRIEVISRGRLIGSVENDGDRVRERVGALMVAGGAEKVGGEGRAGGAAGGMAAEAFPGGSA